MNNKMDNKWIENKRNELIRIVNMPSSGKAVDVPDSDKKADSGQVYRFKELRKLALEVGASHISTERQKTANEGELVVGIQAALQTASMLNACRTATKAWKVAATSALASVLSAAAAWAAVLYN
jgi:hypothetical protein